MPTTAANDAGASTPPVLRPRRQAVYFLAGLHYRQLFPELLRPHSEAERTRLRDSIRADGLLVPIVTDERGGVVDGWERLQLLFELGREAEARFDVRAKLGTERKRYLAAVLNDARRHLSASDREELAAKLRGEGHSIRAIAAKLGMSASTVARDLTAAGVPLPNFVRGHDGKSYPAVPPPAEAIEARRVEVEQLRSQGRTLHEIAARLGVSTGTVAADIEALTLAADLAAMEAAGLRVGEMEGPAAKRRGTVDAADKQMVRCPFCRLRFTPPAS